MEPPAAAAAPDALSNGFQAAEEAASFWRGAQAAHRAGDAATCKAAAAAAYMKQFRAIDLFMAVIPSLADSEMRNLLTSEVGSMLPLAEMMLQTATHGEISTKAAPPAAPAASASSSVPIRYRIVQELFATEESYIQCLETLMDVFASPLRPRDEATAAGASSAHAAPAAEPWGIFAKLFSASVPAGGALAVADARPRADSGSDGRPRSHSSAAALPPADALLSASEHGDLFAGVAQLLPLHRMMLAPLRAAVAGWSEQRSDVAAVLASYAPFLKLYGVACGTHAAASRTLDRLLASRPAFAEWVEAQAAGPRCGGQSLPSFLIRPIQRVPRYRLLLEQLVKHTPDDHADAPQQRAALAAIAGVARGLDEQLRRQAAQCAVHDAAARFLPPQPQLVEPHRLLVREGRAEEGLRLVTKRGERVPVALFLFNDAYFVGYFLFNAAAAAAAIPLLLPHERLVHFVGVSSGEAAAVAPPAAAEGGTSSQRHSRSGSGADEPDLGTVSAFPPPTEGAGAAPPPPLPAAFPFVILGLEESNTFEAAAAADRDAWVAAIGECVQALHRTATARHLQASLPLPSAAPPAHPSPPSASPSASSATGSASVVFSPSSQCAASPAASGRSPAASVCEGSGRSGCGEGRGEEKDRGGEGRGGGGEHSASFSSARARLPPRSASVSAGVHSGGLLSAAVHNAQQQDCCGAPHQHQHLSSTSLPALELPSSSATASSPTEPADCGGGGSALAQLQAAVSLHEAAEAAAMPEPPHALASMLGVAAPVMVPDTASDACMLPGCGSGRFHWLRNPRHHCRRCGLLVCGPCSQARLKALHSDRELQRVCDRCCEPAAVAANRASISAALQPASARASAAARHGSFSVAPAVTLPAAAAAAFTTAAATTFLGAPTSVGASGSADIAHEAAPPPRVADHQWRAPLSAVTSSEEADPECAPVDPVGDDEVSAADHAGADSEPAATHVPRRELPALPSNLSSDNEGEGGGDGGHFALCRPQQPPSGYVEVPVDCFLVDTTDPMQLISSMRPGEG